MFLSGFRFLRPTRVIESSRQLGHDLVAAGKCARFITARRIRPDAADEVFAAWRAIRWQNGRFFRSRFPAAGTAAVPRMRCGMAHDPLRSDRRLADMTREHISGVAMLLLVTMLWGSTFVAIKGAVDTTAPSVLIFGRFLI